MILAWYRIRNAAAVWSWYGIGVALVLYWYGIGVALVWYWHDIGMIWV